MKFREITQHNSLSLVTIMILLSLDIVLFTYFYGISFYSFTISTIKFYLYLVGFIFIIYISKGYNPSPIASRKSEIINLLRNFSIAGMVYFFMNSILYEIPVDNMAKFISFLFNFLIILILIRLIIRWVQRIFLNAKIGLRNVIIFGISQPSLSLVSKLKESPLYGYNLIGYVASHKDANMDDIIPYLGKPEDIKTIISSIHIDDIIISSSEYDQSQILDLIGKLYNLSVCIKIIPDMYESLTGIVRMNLMDGLKLIDINPDILTEYQKFIKRLMDIIISIIALILLMPLSMLSSLAIKLTSKGSIYYIQTRVGRNNRLFKLFKFRTMYLDSELDSGPVWATVDDPRITIIGKFLRQFRIDEIPQFINVLKGDMSIVGPRPERPFFVEKLSREFPFYKRRFKVRPGITGWAQVVGSYDTSIANVKKKLTLDFYYIENVSLILDFKIMLMTIKTIFLGNGR